MIGLYIYLFLGTLVAAVSYIFEGNDPEYRPAFFLLDVVLWPLVVWLEITEK